MRICLFCSVICFLSGAVPRREPVLRLMCSPDRSLYAAKEKWAGDRGLFLAGTTPVYVKKEYCIHMDLSIIGIAGTLISFTRLRKPVYREPDRTETKQHKQCNL